MDSLSNRELLEVLLFIKGTVQDRQCFCYETPSRKEGSCITCKSVAYITRVHSNVHRLTFTPIVKKRD